MVQQLFYNVAGKFAVPSLEFDFCSPYICGSASPTRPAPVESPRVGTQQGYMVVAVRCR